MLADLAVARYCCLYQCLWLCLGHPLLYLYLLCAWVHSSVCVYVWYVCASSCARFVGYSVTMTVGVATSSAPLSVSAVCLGPFFHLRLRLLCVCACTWFVGSSVYVCCVFSFAKNVEKGANQCSIPRFTR